MTEEDRRNLYETLLRGMAQHAQDQLCHADEQHAWGIVERFVVKSDLGPMQYLPVGKVSPDKVYITRCRRRCENCGKEEVF